MSPGERPGHDRSGPCHRPCPGNLCWGAGFRVPSFSARPQSVFANGRRPLYRLFGAIAAVSGDITHRDIWFSVLLEVPSGSCRYLGVPRSIRDLELSIGDRRDLVEDQLAQRTIRGAEQRSEAPADAERPEAGACPPTRKVERTPEPEGRGDIAGRGGCCGGGQDE